MGPYVGLAQRNPPIVLPFILLVGYAFRIRSASFGGPVAQLTLPVDEGRTLPGAPHRRNLKPNRNRPVVVSKY